MFGPFDSDEMMGVPLRERARIKKEVQDDFLDMLTGMLLEKAPDEDSKNQLRLLNAHRDLEKYSMKIVESYGPATDVLPCKRSEALKVLQTAVSMLKDYSERK